MSKAKQPKKPIHLQLDTEIDEWLTELARKNERTKIAQIRVILSEHKKREEN